MNAPALFNYDGRRSSPLGCLFWAYCLLPARRLFDALIGAVPLDRESQKESAVRPATAQLIPKWADYPLPHAEGLSLPSVLFAAASLDLERHVDTWKTQTSGCFWARRVLRFAFFGLG